MGSSARTELSETFQLLGAATIAGRKKKKKLFTFDGEHHVDGGRAFGVLSETRVRSRVLLLGAVDLQGPVVMDTEPRPFHRIGRIVFAPGKKKKTNDEVSPHFQEVFG